MSSQKSLYNLSGQILIAGCFLLAVVAIFATPDCLRAEAEPPFRSLIIGSDEIFVQRPLKGGFVLPDCGTRLVLPEAWHDNVVLVDMPGTGDAAAKAVYGLLFYPPDIIVQVQQYLGAVLVYDRAFMDDIGDETAIKLGATADCVFLFYNSLFNPYSGLPESARFEALMLPDDKVGEQLKIEELINANDSF